MGTPVTVKNATDTYVNQGASGKSYGQKARIWLQAAAGQNKVGLIYFAKPFAAGVTIQDGKVRVWNAEAWSGSVTLTIQRADSKWSVNKVKYGTRPGGIGATVSVTKSNAAAGTMWEFDVTALLQSVANGTPWYGFIITTNRSTAGSIYSTQAGASSMRPAMIVQWNDPPDEPDDLIPRDSLQVSVQRPILQYDFNDTNGDSDLAAQQIQFGASTALLDAGTTTWDSGEAATTVPEFNTAIPISRSVASVVTNATTTITFPSGAINSSDIGGTITGTGIPAGATITAVPTATSATISAAATASGTITATVGRIWGGLANAASTAWRVRTKDQSGIWSVYSDAVLFGRTNKGTLTITAPTGSITEGSPVVSWTYTGQTQRAYQVAIALASDPNNWLWDSGKITSTSTSQSIPFGIIKDASLQYIIIVRVWDTVARVATPDDPMYAEAITAALGITYDATVANVTSLSATSDPLLPVEHISFVDSTAPDSYQLQRSDDGGTTWQYVKEVLPGEVNTGGTNYTIDDNGAAQYTAFTWRVLRVVAGKQGGPATIPMVSGQVRKLAPFLTRKDGSDAVCFLNPQRNREFMDQQGVYQTQAGAIVVTQDLGGSGGSVSGRFTADSMPGVTAKQQYLRFKRLRQDTGQQMTLYIADEAFNVVAYNMQVDTLVDIGGITYQASFDWVEVPES